MSEFLSHRTDWLVWRSDDSEGRENARSIQAFDAESAAKRWAERTDADSADYTIVRGSPAEVIVAEDKPGSEEVRFSVWGESCPTYWADRIR